MNKYDFIIVGSGISGLNFALNIANKGRVLVVTKKKIIDSSTNYAQGGIAAVLDKLDNFNKHIKDTFVAGSYHNNKKAVNFMIKKGPKLIDRLLNLGVKFSNEQNKLQLAKEGGHSMRRIAHVGDRTGHSIEKVLISNVQKNKNITIWENTFAIDLLVKNSTCYGLQILRNGEVKNLFSSAVILATGGLGQVYKHTSNPSISTGDGIAIATRAGAKTEDMEFVQFHPTVLNLPQKKRFLLSEALRGEGAVLKNYQGKRFMKKYDKREELAPRDIVSRAIFKELKKGPVYLDISHKPASRIRKRFPYITKELKKRGLDLTKQKIPISPAMHYMCGGIKVNLHGQSNIKNLYAFGEVACTGVHGANRLASNSLLEAIVFSNQIIKSVEVKKISTVPKFKKFKPKKCKCPSSKYVKSVVKKVMWDNVGIVRNVDDLKKTLEKLKKLDEKYKVQILNQTDFETRNIIQTALLITKAALKRKKSLGCHFII
ncbi:L-aspartate oxidase [bacterium]|nr:L-aspartate oxidase [bacterium]